MPIDREFPSLPLHGIDHPQDGQHSIVSAVVGAHATGERRFALVIPAFSEKRRVLSQLVHALGRKMIVLSPNIAVQSTWYDRYGDMSSPLEQAAAHLWGASTTTVVSTLPYSCAPVVLVTHQFLSRSSGDAVRSQAESDRMVGHFVKYGYRLLVLDESDVLPDPWAELVRSFVSRADVTVVHLTSNRAMACSGTFPLAESLAPWRVFAITIPSLVRSGILPPYRNLLYATMPAEREREILEDADSRLLEALAPMRDPHPDFLNLDDWIHVMLQHEKLQTARNEITTDEEAPTDASLRGALSRFVTWSRNPDARGINRENCSLTPGDCVTLLDQYARSYLGNLGHPDARDRILFLKETLLFTELRHPNWDDSSQGWVRALSTGKAQAHAVRTILKSEYRVRGDALAAVIVTYPVMMDGPAESDADASRGASDTSALSILYALLEDDEVVELHPVQLSGSSFLCADEMVIPVLSEIQKLINLRGWGMWLSHHSHGDISAVHGSGPDWNSRTYAVIAGELLQRGITRCVIGDSLLFRSGWTHLHADTVIDLTASPMRPVFAHPVTTLPVQGDSAPALVHYWDIAVVIPSSIFGMSKWNGIEQMLSGQFTPAEDSILEQGIGQISPRYSHSTVHEAASLALQHSGASRSIPDRDSGLRLWNIGGEARGEARRCVEVLFTRPAEYEPERPHRQQLEHDLSAYLERIHIQRLQYTLLGVMSLGLALSGFLLLPTLPGIVFSSVLALIGFGAGFWRTLKLRRRKPRTATISGNAFLDLLAEALRQAITVSEVDTGDTVTGIRLSGSEPRKELVLSSTVRSDSTSRYVAEGDAVHVSLFVSSFTEMLEHPLAGKYLVRLFRIDTGDRTCGELTRLTSIDELLKPDLIFPMPAAFAADAGKAVHFMECIERVIGRAHLMEAKESSHEDDLTAEHILPVRVFQQVIWM